MDKLINKNDTLAQFPDNINSKHIIWDVDNSKNVENPVRFDSRIDYIENSEKNNFTDYYVYEWLIKDTGEIFYVGHGRGDSYKDNHQKEPDAITIRKLYDTDIKIIAKNLTREQAWDIETEEMARILNETTYSLTNRNTPFPTKRDNGYSRSPDTPPYMFETAPIIYAREIDEHYYNIKPRPFDQVEYKNLSFPTIISRGPSREELATIYSGRYEHYYRDVISLLEQNGSKIIKSRYTKSVTAWIYPCEANVAGYEEDEANAQERIGRRIPAYHLIDVWKFLKNQFGNAEIPEQEPIEINPVHNRVPLSEIKNMDNWDKAFEEGYKYWVEGDAERKSGNIEKAIQLFDKARYYGYSAPALYKSYAMAYRHLGDLDNEIAILDEAIERYRASKRNYSINIVQFEDQKRKAIDKLMKKKIFREALNNWNRGRFS